MLQLFGLFTVAAMLVTYALEARSHWYVIGFYLSCMLGALYCLLQGAWPFAAGELVWAGIAFYRWLNVRFPAP